MLLSGKIPAAGKNHKPPKEKHQFHDYTRWCLMTTNAIRHMTSDFVFLLKKSCKPLNLHRTIKMISYSGDNRQQIYEWKYLGS